MKIILLLAFLSSCTSIHTSNISQPVFKEFPENLKYNEFKKILNEYVNASTFPNINE